MARRRMESSSFITEKKMTEMRIDKLTLRLAGRDKHAATRLTQRDGRAPAKPPKRRRVGTAGRPDSRTNPRCSGGDHRPIGGTGGYRSDEKTSAQLRNNDARQISSRRSYRNSVWISFSGAERDRFPIQPGNDFAQLDAFRVRQRPKTTRAKLIRWL